MSQPDPYAQTLLDLAQTYRRLALARLRSIEQEAAAIRKELGIEKAEINRVTSDQRRGK